MLSFIEKNIFRVNTRLLRFYTTNLENITVNKNSPEILYNDDDIIDQSWDAKAIRSDDTKSLRIAMLGLPNVGKSTLINQLVGRPICATSSKAQTTRVKSNAVYIDGDIQLIFMDTPGLVTNKEIRKYKLDNSFRTDVDKALTKADIVGVVQDVANPFKAKVLDERILVALKNLKTNIPSLLILNKIDKVKRKKELLEIVDVLTSEKCWPHFTDIFMISALQSDGVDDLRKYFIDSSIKRDWDYERDTISDEAPAKLIEQSVRGKFMDILPQELSYLLKIETEHMNALADGSVSTIVSVSCPSDRISKIIMGKGGERVKMVAQLAEQDLCQMFRTAVRLKIAVKFTEEKDKNELIKNKIN